jgi:hypothetical protein
MRKHVGVVMKTFYRLCTIGVCILLPHLAIASPIDVGVFYFPGWTDFAKGLTFKEPWKPIKDFPEREPLLGWYRDSSPNIIKQQTQWMSEYNINFVVFDWYWQDGAPLLEAPLKNYLAGDSKVRFAVMWSNHGPLIKAKSEFDQMLTYWADHYLQNTRYERAAAKPLIFIYSGSAFESQAKAFGMSSSELIAHAREIFKQHNINDVSFAGGGGANTPFARNVKEDGFDFLFSYNYHSGPSGRILDHVGVSHSYSEFSSAYQEQWDWYALHSTVPYIYAGSSGWDRRPWGGSSDAAHDESVSTPASFASHLAALKNSLESDAKAQPKLAIICCWNEFGEGSYIEPTKKDGFTYLKAVKQVFGGK